ERKPSVLWQRKHGLDQALAESVLAQNPGAIMILKSSGDDLGRRRGVSIYQDDDRIILSVGTAPGIVGLFSRGATAMRNDDLALPKVMTGDGYAFIQEPAGILAQIEEQPFDVVLTQLLEVVF